MAEILYRAAHLRAEPDASSRSAVYVAATEAPVDTVYGREVLRMSGCDMSRYERNPVLLDAHRRGSCSDVVGRGEVTLTDGGRTLEVRAEYLDDEDGERVWRKVRAGAIRAVSIGYSINPDSVVRLREGEVDGDGPARVEGPALIVNEWELLEVSNVPVPADANAVRRDVYTRALSANTKEAAVSDPNEAAPPVEAKRAEDDTPDTPESDAGQRMDADEDDAERADCDCEGDEDCDCDEERMSDEDKDDERAAHAPDDRADRMAAERNRFAAAAPESLREFAEETFFLAADPDDPERLRASGTWAAAFAMCPARLRESLEDAIKADPFADLGAYRKALIEARNEASPPVTTPEPVAAVAPASTFKPGDLLGTA